MKEIFLKDKEKYFMRVTPNITLFFNSYSLINFPINILLSKSDTLTKYTPLDKSDNSILVLKI
jgi:hypothetical protein